MEHFRCHRYRRITELADREIESFQNRFKTEERPTQLKVIEAMITTAKRAKASQLNGHLKKCPVCR